MLDIRAALRLAVVLACSGVCLADAPPAKTRRSPSPDTLAVMRAVRQIDKAKLRTHFVDVMLPVDNGAYLTVYGTRAQPRRIRFFVGLSSQADVVDFYYQAGRLICARTRTYAYATNTREYSYDYDERKMRLRGQSVYYFRGKRLIGSRISQHDSEWWERKTSNMLQMGDFLYRHRNSRGINLESWNETGKLPK
jgi:hypothetical protein